MNMHELIRVLLLATTLAAGEAHAAITMPIPLPGDTPASGIFPNHVSITPDGRLVAFTTSTELIVDTPAPQGSVYLIDRVTNQLELISKVPAASPIGVFALRQAMRPQITDDGQFVSFLADASLEDGSAPSPLVWVTDRFNDDLILGSAAADGALVGNRLTTGAGEGRIMRDSSSVVFVSGSSAYVNDDSNGLRDIFVHNLSARETTRVNLHPDGSESFGDAMSPIPSANGQYILFSSDDTELVPGDTNGRRDWFILDTQGGSFARANVGRNGEQLDSGAGTMYAFSGNGRYFVFDSGNLFPDPDGEGLEDIGVFDRTRGTSVPFREFTAVDFRGVMIPQSNDIVISDDGRLVVFHAVNLLPVIDPPTRGGAQHLYMADTVTREVIRIDQGPGQELADQPAFKPALAQDTRSVLFQSTATNLGGNTSTIMYERIPGVADTAISFSGPSIIQPDEGIVVFSVVLTNRAPTPLPDGYAVITSPLFTNYDATTPGGECNEVGAFSVIHCVLAELPPGASATISLEVDPFRLSPIGDHEFSVFGGSIGDFDASPEDNRSTKTVSIADDLPEPTPSGGSGGGGGLGGVFLGAMLALLRQRHRAIQKQNSLR